MGLVIRKKVFETCHNNIFHSIISYYVMFIIHTHAHAHARTHYYHRRRDDVYLADTLNHFDVR